MRGTFEGLDQKEVIAHIKSLGVSSVELLPIHAFFNDSHLTRGETGRVLDKLEQSMVGARSANVGG
jgi:pullulanase/glycogen debranching enzyme